MSFRANGMTWVLRTIQSQLFSYQNWLEQSSQTLFAQFVILEQTLQERTRNEFWGKRDDLGVKKNSNATLFVPKVARTVFMNGFRTVCRTGTKTPGMD